MGDELAGVLDEVGEQAELGRRERDLRRRGGGPGGRRGRRRGRGAGAGAAAPARSSPPAAGPPRPGRELREATAAW